MSVRLRLAVPLIAVLASLAFAQGCQVPPEAASNAEAPLMSDAVNSDIGRAIDAKVGSFVTGLSFAQPSREIDIAEAKAKIAATVDAADLAKLLGTAADAAPAEEAFELKEGAATGVFVTRTYKWTETNAQQSVGVLAGISYFHGPNGDEFVFAHRDHITPPKMAGGAGEVRREQFLFDKYNGGINVGSAPTGKLASTDKIPLGNAAKVDVTENYEQYFGVPWKCNACLKLQQITHTLGKARGTDQALSWGGTLGPLVLRFAGSAGATVFCAKALQLTTRIPVVKYLGLACGALIEGTAWYLSSSPTIDKKLDIQDSLAEQMDWCNTIRKDIKAPPLCVPSTPESCGISALKAAKTPLDLCAMAVTCAADEQQNLPCIDKAVDPADWCASTIAYEKGGPEVALCVKGLKLACDKKADSVANFRASCEIAAERSASSK
jgi:hypothetical protein